MEAIKIKSINILKRLLYLIFLALFGSISSSNAQGFREISQKIGIKAFCLDEHLMGGGVAFFDYNQDYYIDIFIIGGEKNNSLYRNNWDGTFSNVSQLAGIELPAKNTVGVAVGDIDNDGDDDLFITTNEGEANVLMENMGDGTFEDISAKAGITDISWSTSASFGDFNLDGLLDLYVNNYADFEHFPVASNFDRCIPNFLYQNLGQNQFVEVAQEMGVADNGCGLAVTFTDCDNDTDQDLYVANDFGLNFKANELFINSYPEHTFQKTGDLAGVNYRINSMGIAIGDYDEDGDLDYYITNIADNPLFENTGQGGFFREVSPLKGVNNPDGTSWGTAFMDYNNDSYLDLVVANGKVIEAAHQNDENRLFEGNAAHQFSDVSTIAGIASTETCRGMSFADLDKDGDLDVLFGVVDDEKQSEANTLLYQNNTTSQNNWLKIKLEGKTSNRNGYGTRLRVVLGNRTIIREADGGSSYLSHSANEIHFGLGQFAQIDSLIINWPGGNQDVITGPIPSNHSLKVVENSHWYYYRNEIVSLPEGDSIFLDGAFRHREAIYHHMVYGVNSQDSLLVITKLQVEDPSQNINQAIEISAFPNPFHSDLWIQYKLPEEGAGPTPSYGYNG